MDLLNFNTIISDQIYQEIEAAPCCTFNNCYICSEDDSQEGSNMEYFSDVFLPVMNFEQFDIATTFQTIRMNTSEIPEVIRQQNTNDMEIIREDDTFDVDEKNSDSDPKEDDEYDRYRKIKI